VVLGYLLLLLKMGGPAGGGGRSLCGECGIELFICSLLTVVSVAKVFINYCIALASG